ncbi:MAG: ATP-binding protein [Candidatus Manganitrophus sp.]|nr:MAG: ATP-binding protein [Candidatus Manganitrophus sp.]
MGKPLRVLIVEDSEDDCLLLLRELRRGGYDPLYERVQRPEAMAAALAKQEWEIIISDYTMPYFDALAALDLLKRSGKDIPFVISSGSIGEETAVAAMKRGASDYLLKDNLTRLNSVIERELRDAEDRRARRRVEEALRQSEARLRAILDAALDAIITIDHKGKIVEFNPAAERVFGYGRDQAIGRGIDDFILSNPLRETRREGLVHYLEEGLAPLGQRIEWAARRADGYLFPIELAMTRIANEGPPMFTGFIRDIADRKRSEEEMRLLIEELKEKTFRAEEASRFKSQLLSNVSHELRTPINAVIGYTSLFLDGNYGPLSAEQQAPLESVQRNVNDLLMLVNHLLDLERLESGRLDVERGPVDLEKVLQEAYTGIKFQLEEKGLPVRWDLPEELAPITSDYQKIKQLFVNLLSNAVKFTDQGEITIKVRELPERGGVEVAIRDTGIGIPPDLLPKIFEPFFQADGTMTRRHGGVGLGLAIVKDFLRLLGGEIRVESEPGKGSTFTVFLPYDVGASFKPAPTKTGLH